MSRDKILPPEQETVTTTTTKTTVSTNHGMYGSGEGNTVKHSYGGIHIPGQKSK